MNTLSSLIIILCIFLCIYFILWKMRRTELIERFTAWIVFNVILALAPLVFAALVIYITGHNPTITELLSNGELFILSVAIGGQAAGKLIASSKKNRTIKLTAAGGSIILVVVCSLLFALVSGSVGLKMDLNRISSVSNIMYFLTLVASASCVLLAEAEV